MATDHLDLILAYAGVDDEPRVEHAELEAICRRISLVPAEEFIEASTRAPGLTWEDGRIRRAGSFEIHDGRWWIDVSDDGSREYLLTISIAAVLVDTLHLALSISWIAAVLPAVIAVRSVSTDDAGLHLDLVRQAEIRLPPHLADTVNPEDFAEFAAAVAAAPAVLPIPVGGAVTFTGR